MKLKSGIIFIISYVLFCIQMPFSDVGMQKVNLITIFEHYVIIEIVFGIICNLVFFISHLVQSISYGIMGFGNSPVLCYPFVFGANRKRPIQIFWNFFYMAEYFYPKKLYIKTAQKYDDFKVGEVCKKAQMNGLIAQISTCVIAAFVCLVWNKYFIALAFIVLGIAFVVLAFGDTKTYQGVFAMRKYMEKGYLPVYLARQLIFYDNEYHPIYEKFENKILEEIPSNILKKYMETTKHMYMIKCENSKFDFREKEVAKVVEEKFLLHKMEDFQNLEYGSEGFELLKVYLCYAMLNNDTMSYRLAMNILERLCEQERRNTLFHFDTFHWYYYMGKNYKMLKQQFLKNKVIRPDGFFCNFQNYKSNCDSISFRMNILCNIDDLLEKNN